MASSGIGQGEGQIPLPGSQHLLAYAEPFNTLLYLGDEKSLVPDDAASNHRAPVSLGAGDCVVQSLQ